MSKPSFHYGQGFKAMSKKGTTWYVAVESMGRDFWQNTFESNRSKAESKAIQITDYEYRKKLKELPCGNVHCPICPPPSLSRVHHPKLKRIISKHRPPQQKPFPTTKSPHPGRIGQIENEYGDWRGQP